LGVLCPECALYYFEPDPICTLDALQHPQSSASHNQASRFIDALPLGGDTPSVFSNLTHLEVMDMDWDLLDLFPRLPFMPTLTHLAVNSFFDDTTDYDAVRS
jgi:hypothetical protein